MQQLKLGLAPPCWRLLSGSWRINETPLRPASPGRAVIFACLHRDILPAIRYCRPAMPTLLVSKSSDGQILRRTLAQDGYGCVRGSTGHDGREGFVGLLRALRRGRHVGIAVDGPRGPFGTVHGGVLLLAKLAPAPIVPLAVRGRGCLRLGTWDRTVVPLFWARVDVTAGQPLWVPGDAGPQQIEELRAELRRCLGTDVEAADATP